MVVASQKHKNYFPHSERSVNWDCEGTIEIYYISDRLQVFDGARKSGIVSSSIYV